MCVVRLWFNLGRIMRSDIERERPSRALRVVLWWIALLILRRRSYTLAHSRAIITAARGAAMRAIKCPPSSLRVLRAMHDPWYTFTPGLRRRRGRTPEPKDTHASIAIRAAFACNNFLRDSALCGCSLANCYFRTHTHPVSVCHTRHAGILGESLWHNAFCCFRTRMPSACPLKLP